MSTSISHNHLNMLFKKENDSLFSKGAFSSNLDFLPLLVSLEKVML